MNKQLQNKNREWGEQGNSYRGETVRQQRQMKNSGKYGCVRGGYLQYFWMIFSNLYLYDTTTIFILVD